MTGERRFILSSDSAFQQAKQELIHRWEERGGEAYEVIFRPYKKNRSVESNRYYWAAVITPFANFVGLSPEEMHETLLAEIYGTKIVEFRGHKREVPNRRSHDMNTEEFALHIEHCIRIAAEQGFYIQPDWSAAA